MHVPSAPRPTAIGFLTIVSDPGLGYVGGYLITNRTGRPLEFHCTAPVRPTRAQEILYGPSLEPYLCGELIGQALLSKASTSPALVCTDCAAAGELRGLHDAPLALVAPHEVPGWRAFTALGGQTLAVSIWHADDQPRIESLLAHGFESLDLAEPFERIREAIREAQRSAA